MISLALLAGVEIARAIIVAYAVYLITLSVTLIIERYPVSGWQIVAAIGGAVYLAGLILWRYAPGADIYDLDLFLQTAGIALMVLPRIVIVLRRVMADV